MSSLGYRVLAGISVALSIFAAAGSVQAQEGSPTLERAKERGFISICLTSLVPYATFENGAWTGPTITMVNEISKRTGIPVEYVDIGFGQVVPAIVAGTIDIAVHPLSITPARLEVIGMTEYVSQKICAIVRKDSKYTELSQLNSADVTQISITGSGYIPYILEKFPNMTIKTRDQLPGEGPIMREVPDGQADVAMSDVEYWLLNRKTFPDLRAIPEDCPTSGYAIEIPVAMGYPKGDPALKAFLDQIGVDMSPVISQEILDMLNAN